MLMFGKKCVRGCVWWGPLGESPMLHLKVIIFNGICLFKISILCQIQEDQGGTLMYSLCK